MNENGERLIIEVHFQERVEPHRTILLARREFSCDENAKLWAEGVFTSRIEECPEGYGPMVRVIGNGYFVRAPDDASQPQEATECES